MRHLLHLVFPFQEVASINAYCVYPKAYRVMFRSSNVQKIPKVAEHFKPPAIEEYPAFFFLCFGAPNVR